VLYNLRFTYLLCIGIFVLSVLSGIELSTDADRGASSPFVSAGFVSAVLQSVYASNRSHDVTDTSLGAAVNDVCHFLLSKVSPMTDSHQYGVFGAFFYLICHSVNLTLFNIIVFHQDSE